VISTSPRRAWSLRTREKDEHVSMGGGWEFEKVGSSKRLGVRKPTFPGAFWLASTCCALKNGNNDSTFDEDRNEDTCPARVYTNCLTWGFGRTPPRPPGRTQRALSRPLQQGQSGAFRRRVGIIVDLNPCPPTPHAQAFDNRRQARAPVYYKHEPHKDRSPDGG